MATVTINSGPVDASDALRDVPKDRWFELMQVRRDFLDVHLVHDCRRLLEFVEDADRLKIRKISSRAGCSLIHKMLLGRSRACTV